MSRPHDGSVLALRGVDKRFPGVHALKDVVDRGPAADEVVGLVGENGAGKSTLMKILRRRLPARLPARSRIAGRPVALAERRPTPTARASAWCSRSSRC